MNNLNMRRRTSLGLEFRKNSEDILDRIKNFCRNLPSAFPDRSRTRHWLHLRLENQMPIKLPWRDWKIISMVRFKACKMNSASSSQAGFDNTVLFWKSASDFAISIMSKKNPTEINISPISAEGTKDAPATNFSNVQSRNKTAIRNPIARPLDASINPILSNI